MRKNVLQVLLLSTFVLFLPAWAGAQSEKESTSSTNTASSAAQQTEQQEMREELKALRAEVERLRAEVEQQKGVAPAPTGAAPSVAAVRPATAVGSGEPATAVATATGAAPGNAVPAASLAQTSGPTTPGQSAESAPAKKTQDRSFFRLGLDLAERQPADQRTAFDSKFFTPEIRADITYTYDFNKPKDNSMGGSSELFRSNEIQLEQLGVGGDFHYDNVRARFMTQFGMYSTATPAQ